MRIYNIDMNKGVLEAQVEDINDLFALWNFLRPGDLVEAITARKVKFEGTSERKKMKLTIVVEKLAFHEMLETLRIGGRIFRGPENFAPLGAYHTIQLRVGSKVKIMRSDGFSEAEIEVLKEADTLRRLNPIIIIAIERDEATIGVLTGRSLEIFSSVYQHISYKDASDATSLRNAFFKKVLELASEVMSKYRNISGIIIAGPSLTKEEFAEFLRRNLGDRVPIILDQASSGTEAAINEVLRRGTVLKITNEFLVASDLKDYEEFLEHLGRGDGLACYGLEAVSKAIEWGAAKKLLVIIDLINNPECTVRSKILEYIKRANDFRAKIRIISRVHPLHDKIKNFGGIIALLRYRLHGDLGERGMDSDI